jgi:hypothetical protein
MFASPTLGTSSHALGSLGVLRIGDPRSVPAARRFLVVMHLFLTIQDFPRLGKEATYSDQLLALLMALYPWISQQLCYCIGLKNRCHRGS